MELPLRMAVHLGPREQLRRLPGVYDRSSFDHALDASFATIGLPFQLPDVVRIGVDGEAASEVERNAHEPARWVQSFGARIDLDRLVVFRARGEDTFRVERRLGPPA